MIDIHLLRNDFDRVAQNLQQKKFHLDKDYFQNLENKRKILQTSTEELQAKRNNLSKQIGVLKSRAEPVDAVLAEVAQLGDNLQKNMQDLAVIQQELTNWLHQIPNLIDDTVPCGDNADNNQEVRKYGTPQTFTFPIQDHVSLGFALNQELNFELARKMSGSRFVVLTNQVAKLHRVLAQFMLDVHISEHGYTETYVPYMVNAQAVFGTGQLPKFECDLFKIKRGDENWYLIPTAEVPLTNLVADMVLNVDNLPLKFVAHSPCFRSEAGSYGRDTKGMIRLHQFDKVEMVQIVKPENSNQALEEITQHAEHILQKLDLPYRVMLLCSGDLGFSSSKTYDLEVWIPSQNMYREISSVSNMTDYQTRRLQARYKNPQGKNELVHSLNGSGLAVGRTLVAILENYQNQDGSITVPEVLRERMGCERLSPKK